MAVVQISKIQIRRGRKLTDIGMPQLASGELAWAIDTQELYVGNGAVAEGAPAVGNTKVLTENDNILDLLNQYQYKPSDTTIQTGALINFPTKRSLQERLDEGAVNAKSFGISNLDETVDQTSAIQNAIWSLFGTTSEYNRVALEFDPGEYKVSGTIYLPSNVKIVGSGKDRTVFNFVRGGINSGTTFTFAGTSVAVEGTYTDLPLTTSTGSGVDARVNVIKTGTGTTYVGTVEIEIINSGSGYADGDIVIIPGNLLGGASPANDLTITLSNEATTLTSYPTFGTTTLFECVNEVSTREYKNGTGPLDADSIATNDLNRPKNVSLSNFAVTSDTANVQAFDLRNLKNSDFFGVKLLGNWDNPVDVTPSTDSIGFNLSTLGAADAFAPEELTFRDCHVENFVYGVYTDSDSTKNKIIDSKFKHLYYGIVLGVGAVEGATYNSITGSTFTDVYRNGILVELGYGNRSKGNTFLNVGSDLSAPSASGGTSTQVGPIKFVSAGNSSDQDEFDRHYYLGSTRLSPSYGPQLEGNGLLNQPAVSTVSLPYNPTRDVFLRFPLNEGSGIKVDYVFRSTVFSQTRRGTLYMIVDNDRDNVQLVDEYEYVGTSGEDLKLTFEASLVTSAGGVKSVNVLYTNVNTADVNTFTYTYSILNV